MSILHSHRDSFILLCHHPSYFLLSHIKCADNFMIVCERYSCCCRRIRQDGLALPSNCHSNSRPWSSSIPSSRSLGSKMVSRHPNSMWFRRKYGSRKSNINGHGHCRRSHLRLGLRLATIAIRRRLRDPTSKIQTCCSGWNQRITWSWWIDSTASWIDYDQEV